MEEKPKYNRRKILAFSAIVGVPALLGKFFLSSGEKVARRVAALSEIDFKSLSFVKSYSPLESKTSTRFLLAIAKIKFKVKTSKGHNTRQFADLTEYAPSGDIDLSAWRLDKLLEASIEERERNTKNFYIRTEKPNQLTFEIKKFEVCNAEGKSVDVKVSEVKEKARDLGIYMLECAGNDRYSKFGLMSASKWSGIPVSEFIAEEKFQGAREAHTHVLVEGFDESTNTNWNRFPGLVESTPGASWIFTLEELKKHKAFFATSMNGEDLTADHGYPLRLVVPNFYGCASIKWLNKVTFFTPTDKTPTEQQMREFSDRTNQEGVPMLYKDHRSPVVDLASVPVKVEKWYDNTTKQNIIRLIGLTWGGIDEVNPKLKIIITKRKWIRRRSKHKGQGATRKRVQVVVEEKIIDAAERVNTLSFSHWTHWWVPPKKGRYYVHLEPVDDNIVARRLRRKYYQRMIKV
ncbi:MAG: hypothetical protein CME70_22475 [Halobacteriovorax sp.]|nr:hypothetical protein [Halobacteriovorax sp.]|tara:strand:+ start:76718 stop:78100 length:1383 start_codon:yes stop_codon:yes gene_type:complete